MILIEWLVERARCIRSGHEWKFSALTRSYWCERCGKDNPTPKEPGE